MSAETIRVGIVDDDRHYRQALESYLLARQCEIVFSADDYPSTLRSLENHTPDVLLIDYVMPGLDGAEILRRIQAQGLGQGALCLFMTNYNEPAKIQECLDLNAVGYVTKGHTPANVLQAIHAALAGERPVIMAGIDATSFSQVMRPLSTQERAVAVLLAEGLEPGEIAARLNLGKRTVYQYRRSIRKKMGLGDDEQQSGALLARLLRQYLTRDDSN